MSRKKNNNTLTDLELALDNLICSASGWRKKFNLLHNTLQDYDILFFYYAIKSFIHFQETKQKKKTLHFALALDTRIANIDLLSITEYAINTSQSNSCLLGIAPIPAALAYTKKYADALIFITASHNPEEYSGIKFCNGNGQIITPNENTQLISKCMKLVHTKIISPRNEEQTHLLSKIKLSKHYMNFVNINNAVNATEQNNMLTQYTDTLNQAVLRGLENIQTIIYSHLRRYKQITNKSPSIIWDVNGGARCWENDRKILQSYGIPLHRLHTTPGQFVHEIVPEGKALQDALHTLSQINSENNARAYLFAIISDCDGDRGNIVLYNFTKKCSIKISAQQVFSLILNIELAWEKYILSINKNTDTGSIQKNAVVINDASSLQSNHIAESYNTSIFRSEVGEANVLSLSEELRLKKYNVPLSGEASNGGVIMYPSFVRDPLHTAVSLLKAVLFFEELFPALATKHTPAINPLISILQSLPKASSTSTEEKIAKLNIPNMPITEIFYRIIKKSDILFKDITALFTSKNIIIDSYKIINHDGKKSKILHAKTIQQKNTLNGGLSIYLYSSSDPIGLLWIRKSATEPVVRIIADVQGKHCKYLERKLIVLWRNFLVHIIQS